MTLHGEAKGTSYAIYKSLQWAADSGARIVNMSFVGPFDPDLHRMLAGTAAKAIVLIAAGGNGGPDSAPQYPASDANVIAVAATDDKDGLFSLDNRNPYIAVAAPGVEILSLAPDDAYQVSTGSSIAAAHVSGIVALMLQIQPSLKPRDIRAILADTAKPRRGARYRLCASVGECLFGGEIGGNRRGERWHRARASQALTFDWRRRLYRMPRLIRRSAKNLR